jgi:restriction system protein
MPVPDYESTMLPLLRLAADRNEHKFRDAIEHLSAEFRLTPEERAQLQPSGSQLLFDNRIGWAVTYLTNAGLLERPRRGFFRITQRGLDVLGENPERVDVELLLRFPEFREFRGRRRSQDADQRQDQVHVSDHLERIVGKEGTPEDMLAAGYRRLRSEVERQILDEILRCSPTFFERLVIDLLVRMGYGGSREDAGQAIGRVGDEGIDGIINEDRLGLDVIYIQAKRWQGTVGRPEVQRFAGALQGRRARKGVMITTSTFTREAVDFAAAIEAHITLIDGARLAALMFEHNVGVTEAGHYEIKRLDSDYFSED